MMIDYLESIDQLIVRGINSWNSPFWDEFMWIVSGKITWIPLYLFLVFLFYRQSGIKKTVFFLLAAILIVTIVDQVSVHLFKNVFLRYRPSHNLLLTEELHFYKIGDNDFYKGGLYGFVSSHAANFFAVCTFAYLGLRKRYSKIFIFLFSAAILVSFSRIYLGVHYLSDVLVGAMLGILVATLVFRYGFIPIIGKDYDKK